MVAMNTVSPKIAPLFHIVKLSAGFIYGFIYMITRGRDDEFCIHVPSKNSLQVNYDDITYVQTFYFRSYTSIMQSNQDNTIRNLRPLCFYSDDLILLLIAYFVISFHIYLCRTHFSLAFLCWKLFFRMRRDFVTTRLKLNFER